MQQESGQAGDGLQPAAPLRCPRCNSADTKFRYYNNHDPGQPRHYCRTCRRYWTVGGTMRNVPFGGRRRSNDKPIAEASSSQISAMREPQPALIPPASSYVLNDEISCLAAIQSLTQQPLVGHEPFNATNPFGAGSSAVDMMHVFQDGQFQSNEALNLPALPQQLPSYGGNYWPMNPDLAPDLNHNLGFSAANAGMWDNSSGNVTDPEAATTPMNPNEWPYFPSNFGGPP